jgi:hypothetical protein
MADQVCEDSQIRYQETYADPGDTMHQLKNLQWQE